MVMQAANKLSICMRIRCLVLIDGGDNFAGMVMCKILTNEFIMGLLTIESANRASSQVVFFIIITAVIHGEHTL